MGRKSQTINKKTIVYISINQVYAEIFKIALIAKLRMLGFVAHLDVFLL